MKAKFFKTCLLTFLPGTIYTSKKFTQEFKRGIFENDKNIQKEHIKNEEPNGSDSSIIFTPANSDSESQKLLGSEDMYLALSKY